MDIWIGLNRIQKLEKGKTPPWAESGPQPQCRGLLVRYGPWARLASVAHTARRERTRRRSSRPARPPSVTGWLRWHRFGGVSTRRWWEMRWVRQVGWELTNEVPHRWGGEGETAWWRSTEAVVLRWMVAVSSAPTALDGARGGEARGKSEGGAWWGDAHRETGGGDYVMISDDEWWSPATSMDKR
jgi:hypothetical protein